MRPMVPALIALATLAASGCPKKGGPTELEPPGDPYPGREQSLRGVLKRELEIELIEGYDLPSFETAVPATAVSSRVGAVHFGVDEVTAGDADKTVDRWPLLPVDELGGRLDEARSKRLKIHLAADLSAAWVVDEISYRVPGCLARDGTYKSAVLPLRFTAVFVRDGERWVEVLEHISYPRRTGTLVDAATNRPGGKRMRSGRDPRPAVQEPIDVVSRAIAVDLTPEERARIYASDKDALALWPDPNDELRGSAVITAATLARTFDARAMRLESWRVGMSPDPSGGIGGGSLAWVAATLRLEIDRPAEATVEPVTLRLRASFVLERRKIEGKATWQIVQSHVSAPVDDVTLIAVITGDDGQLDDGQPADAEDSVPWQRPCAGKATSKPSAPVVPLP